MAHKRTSTDTSLMLKLDEALKYLTNQEEKLKPFIEILENMLLEKITKEEVSLEQAFEMFLQMQKQYTDSIILITKIKEIMRYR